MMWKHGQTYQLRLEIPYIGDTPTETITQRKEFLVDPTENYALQRHLVLRDSRRLSKGVLQVWKQAFIQPILLINPSLKHPTRIGGMPSTLCCKLNLTHYAITISRWTLGLKIPAIGIKHSLKIFGHRIS